jgi:hypothetical protein
MDALLNEISHDAYLFSVDDYMPSAWIGHAPFLKFLIRELQPATFVELGVHNGFSYFVGCQAIKECNIGTKAFAIDHWMGDSQAGFYDESVFEEVVHINNKYSNFSTLLKMSFDQASHQFESNSIDLLHIDGFHSYESVRVDFETWIPKLSANAVVLLHDIHVRRDTFGVYKFWKEIKSKHKTLEFVGSHGLGVVFLGEIPPGNLQRLFSYAEEGNIGSIQGTFGSISDDVIQSAKDKIMHAFLAERDSALAERDNALAERDSALAERDSALAERDSVLDSTTWQILAPYRRMKSLIVKG